MELSAQNIVTGRKTFFITPDVSLIPESFLEDFFSIGYECYFVDNDKRISLEEKLDTIISTFQDVILFFNIDANIRDIYWPSFIKKIIDKYNNKAKVGVMYVKHPNKEYSAKLEQQYLYDMELSCGCIQLEYQKRHNFEIIEKILFANQAKGKRVNIRAICPNSCTFSFVYKEKPLSGVLEDISLSHFSFITSKEDLQITLYEKVYDFHLSIRGVVFRSDAVLITKREMDDKLLYVFAFVSTTGSSGLDLRTRQMLVPNIYKLISFNCLSLLNHVYEKSNNKDVLSESDNNIKFLL